MRMSNAVGTYKNNAKLFDPNLLISAGIDPKTGLPIKLGCGGVEHIAKADVKKQLRIMDEQAAINSGTWYNLPEGLNGRLMERILYYKGQGAFFKLNDRFYFLPYALDGSIDVYGRFTGITPLPFNGAAKDDDTPWIRGLTFKPEYDVQLPEDFEGKSVEELESFIKDSCVLLKDYTEQISQTNISRQILNDPIIDLEAECLPFMRTALLNSTGIQGLRTHDADEASNIVAASMTVNRAALEGEKYVAIIGDVDFQDLTNGQVAKAEEFLMAMQSLDNYRLSLHGLDSGGIFQKKSHMLQSEQDMNAGNIGLVMRDRVQNRQDFCNIVNSIFGIGIWYEPSETVVGIDRDGDGTMGSNEDQGTNQGGAEDERMAE
jgi:hypothetical protein